MSTNTSNHSSSGEIFDLATDCGHTVRVYLRPNHRAMKTKYGHAFDGKRAPIALTGPNEHTCFCGVVTTIVRAR